MSGEPTYRLATEEDYPLLLKLWEEDAGWGSFGTELLRESFIDTPFGTSQIVLTQEPDGEISGQFVFIPSLVSVDGREVRALRPFAPILKGRSRGSLRNANPWKHPIAAMYRHATNALQSEGYGLIYMVPDPRWLRFFRMFSFLECGSHPLWSIPLPLAAELKLGDGFTAAPLEKWDSRVDELWERAKHLHPCLVVRTSRTLPYKVGRGGYTTLAIERGGEMVGLVASRQKGGKQWVICDLLAADMGDSLRATLAAAVNLSHEKSVSAAADNPIHKVAVLTTHAMEPVIRSLGFARDAYDFPMAIHVLDPSLTKQAVAPGRGYASAND